MSRADRSEVRERVRRWSKRADLTRPTHRQPVIGDWVVVLRGDRLPEVLLQVVGDGGFDGEWKWETHDGATHPAANLVVLDVADVLREGAELLADIRHGRYRMHGDQTGILRAHRAACLARSVVGRVLLGADALTTLDALVYLDGQIAAAEDAWRTFVHHGLPNLLASLAIAGALHQARRDTSLYADLDPRY